MTTATPGVCRHCGCGVTRLCRLENSDTCCWINPEQTVCSNPACIVAEEQRVAAATRPARKPYSGWGYGAIVQDLRRKERRKKKRRAA